MSQESDALRRAIAAATTGGEQNALAAQLAAHDRAQAAKVRADRDLDWAATATAATLTPVAVHTVHTAATDWLGDISDGAPDFSRRLVAEASLWYSRLSDAVRADDEEFTAQAHGAARRAAGRLGVHPAAAIEPFMDYVAFVRKQGGSGLPEVQQTIDANNAPAPTPLPPQAFDNFAPEVADVNLGVSGTEDSNRAPLLQEIMGEGGGGRPAPGAPAPSPTEQQMPSDGAPDLGDQDDGAGDAEAERDRGALTPNLAVNHVLNLDDFRRQAAMGEDGLFDTGDDDWHAGADDARDLWHDHQRRMNDLPSVTRDQAHARDAESSRRYRDQRYADDVAEYGREFADHLRADRPAPRTHHSAPDAWEHAADATSAYLAARQHTGASGLDQIQQTTAPDGVTPRPTPLPAEVAFPWDISPNASNDDPPTDGEMAQQTPAAHEGRRVRADQWHGQEWPHAAVQPNAANNPGTTPTPPTGDFAAGRAAGSADRMAPDTAPTYADASSAAPDFVRGYTDGYGNPTTPGPVDTPPSLTGPPAPHRLSHRLSTPAERALPDYARGYAAGLGWKAGSASVPSFGNDGFEAGLYAGILDNPGIQESFATVHRDAAPGVRQAGRRIARHASASAAMAAQIGADLVGPYLRLTAGTSTDLDTMAPGTSADPAGGTPFNGPGTAPILDGQYGAADPAGPAPYNGAEPFGTPAVPTPQAPDPGNVTVPATGMTTPTRATAFRRLVQANLVRTAAGAPLLTPTAGSN